MGNLFNWKKKKRGGLGWSHKFVCLSSCEAERVPTGQSHKMLLEEAGLWEKVVTIPDLDCDPETFRKILFSSFPKLRDGGGYELLRCLPYSRELSILNPRISNSPRLLKRRVCNGRVYIRPIQWDLSLDVEDGGVQMVCVCVCACACMHACVHARVRACVSACMSVCVHACVSVRQSLPPSPVLLQSIVTFSSY